MNFLNFQSSLQDFLLSDKFLRIILSLIFFVLFYLVFIFFLRHFIHTLLQQIVSRTRASKKREKQINTWTALLEKGAGAVIFIILFLTILTDFNFNITPILTGAGILGLAIGLGSQNLMKDIIGGIFIFLEGAYNEGDRIQIVGLSGQVKKMTLRKTYLYSEKEKLFHIIPNAEIKTITLKHLSDKDNSSGGLPKKKSVLKE